MPKNVILCQNHCIKKQDVVTRIDANPADFVQQQPLLRHQLRHLRQQQTQEHRKPGITAMFFYVGFYYWVLLFVSLLLKSAADGVRDKRCVSGFWITEPSPCLTVSSAPVSYYIRTLSCMDK